MSKLGLGYRKSEAQLKSAFFILTTIFSIATFSQQFKSSNQFFSTPIYGQVSIRCHNTLSGEHKLAHFSCSDLRLSPVEFDYFVGPANIQADLVSLTSIQSSGQSVDKNVSYQNGQSSSRINLWIKTLFQVPLLDEGKNLISYKMKLKNQVVQEGTFEVLVQRAQPKTCPNGSLLSNTMTDCEGPYSACQKYFNEYNYCF